MLKMLVFGATSAIAHEALKHFASDGASLYLVALDRDQLRVVADDLKVRGAKLIEMQAMNLTDFDQHQAVIDSAIEKLNGLDAVLIAHGTLGNQEASQGSVEVTIRELNINMMSTISLLTILANVFEKQRRGVIAVISSVAGDRGRGSNYVYGTAKAGLTAFLSGLRNRLSKAGVQVLTIKPGMVDTPMTAHMKKSRLFSPPSKVGTDIYNAMKSGRDVIYSPFYWRYIMMIITNIPERIFKKLSL